LLPLSREVYIKPEKLKKSCVVLVFFQSNSQFVTTAIFHSSLPLLILKHVGPLMYVVVC